MTRQLTDRRRRYAHLLGIDRYRLVAVWSDGSRSTESFDEATIDSARRTAAALASPNGEDPGVVEIWAGAWQGIGATDCKWIDHHHSPVATAARNVAGHLTWFDRPTAEPTTTDASQQLAFI